jgi:flagellar biosynthesis/type III secretory pathway protein FliH
MALMTNNKQQMAVEWLEQEMLKPNLSMKEILEQAKEMEIAGKKMSYADGYAEGYKRSLEVMEWYIKTHISGMVQEHISNINKKVDE